MDLCAILICAGSVSGNWPRPARFQELRDQAGKNMKIKKGDQVKMLGGKDKGKIGKVLGVFPDDNKITVENLNLIKKHRRPRREGEKGQRIEIPRRVDASSVMLICPKCGKGTRVGSKAVKDGKVRICKKCNSEI